MASNPPFQVEDTDEDFFDKLVNDDDDFKVTQLSSETTKLGDGNDSDDAKAFANLGISGVEDLGKGSATGEEEKSCFAVNGDMKHKLTDTGGPQLASSNSFAFDSVSEEPRTEVSDCTDSWDHGSGVKEVQWTAFGSESGGNGFGDFFTEFGEDEIGKGLGKLEQNSSSSVVDDYSQDIHANANANANAYGEQNTEGAGGGTDLNSIEYWERLYPGYKFDANTGQWYQVNNEANAHELDKAAAEVSYSQQTVQSAAVGAGAAVAVAEQGTTESVTTWNQETQTTATCTAVWEEENNGGYPSHMLFDPRYPEYYYDSNTEKWYTLDAYHSQANQNGYDQETYGGGGQNQLNKKLAGGSGSDYSSVEQPPLTQDQDQVNQNGYSATYYDQKTNGGQDESQDFSYLSNEGGSSTWQPGGVADISGVQGTSFSFHNHVNQQQQQSFHYEYDGAFNQPFVPSGNLFKQSEMAAYGSINQPSYYGSRSSAGRPPHALVTFGFGGRLIVMKDTSSSYGTTQDANGRWISVHSMAEITSGGVCDYFESLSSRQSYPGPLAGGNVGGKELSKWMDERIAHSESINHNHRGLLLSLLKIASQHYGKLRSPFGTDATSKENDAPEVAVARLFASVKKRDSGAEYNYGHFTNCLQQLPSEREIQATAFEVQTLLVSGKKIEALERAQEGQLWGPALVLAAQLGDQYYVDTVRKMGVRQLVAGSPLRTLCLLIAGQPADAFSATTDGGGGGNMAPGDKNCMIEDWEENLAVITANRTKDDELVLTHLGDCLWKERSNIMAAHICYLIAEANFEAYSDTARLCLIGADHWKHPRTYATPEAIQRTEVYEYAKLLGNSQFTLIPFQPYKLIYAHMLAEVGRLPDSFKYCQSVSRCLKTVRGAPEVEIWRQLVASLEERIKTYQQGGFSSNLAPAKLVGKLLNLFDSTAHRVVGGLPPPVPSALVGGGGGVEHHQQQQGQGIGRGVGVSTTTLVPSASMEPIREWSEDRKMIIHNRSVSEPDFGRQGKENSQSKSSSSSSSRFGRFGFGSQLFQKTVELVLRPRGGDKQAKLGDANKFYYDEKLKRWVEEGADPPPEEPALAPPPTMPAFHQNNNNNGGGEYNLKAALKTEAASLTNGSPDLTSPSMPMPMPLGGGGGGGGIPPLPATTSNQFSARGRTGVRARYVDTFNQGGGAGNLFQSPPPPAASNIKPPNPNPNFFIPQQQPLDNTQQPTPDVIGKPSFSSSASANSSFPHPSSTMARQKFASMDNVSQAQFPNHAMSSPASSRRTASWASFSQQQPPSGHGFGSPSITDDELQEVDL